MELVVTADPKHGHVLNWGAGARHCAVGRSGVGLKRREGDGLTPIGRYPLRRVLYRADRIELPATRLPIEAIAPSDGWCDAPEDPAYNRMVKLPYPARTETLWREDPLYDVVVVIGFNDSPVIPGKGSAIFLHVAREDYAPTEGCVALALTDLLAMLSLSRTGDAIVIRS